MKLPQSDETLRHTGKLALNANVIQIELTLISIVQGLALAQLASSSLATLTGLQFYYWPYISAGFILILLFWTQAIIHTLSFIKWPLEFTHNFLYFIIMFIEVLAFSHITEPLPWFAYNFVFFLCAGLLYYIDLRLLRTREKEYATPEAKALYRDMMFDQTVSLRLYVPLGLLYMLASVAAIYYLPNIFIDQNYHALLALGQTVIGAAVLIRSTQHFSHRAHLITMSVEE